MGLYGQGLNAYNAGLGNINNAIDQGGTMLGLSQMPASTLGQLGQQYQGDTQKVIDSTNQRFGYNQNLPYDTLNQYMQMLQGNNFGTQKSTTSGSSGGSDAMGTLGGMMAANSMLGAAGVGGGMGLAGIGLGALGFF